MKKKLLLLPLLIAGMMLSFVGCGEKDNYAVKGKYQEVTYEEAATKLSALDSEKLLEETQTEEALGISASVGLDKLALSFSAGSGEQALSMNVDANLKASYALKIGTEVQGAGSVSGKIKAEGNALGIDPVDQAIDVELSNENELLYLYNKKDEEGTPSKVKMSLEDIMENLEFSYGDLGMTFAEELPDTSSPDMGGIEMDGILSNLNEYGLKYYVDDSDGLKFKVSATKDTLLKTMESAAENDPWFSVLELGKKDTFAIDFYLSVDAEGHLEKIALDVNVDITLSGGIGENAASVSFTAKGGFSFEVKTVTVTLPSDLDAYVDPYATPVPPSDPEIA